MTDMTHLSVPALRPGRVHEASGAAAPGFALVQAALGEGLCLWIREHWLADMLYPAGLAAVLDPARLLLARTRDQTDSLAVAEEVLKDGAVAFVVAEITRPLNLREGRRLQLAAGSGNVTGLCLIPEGMGSNAAETRWLCQPLYDPAARDDSTLMLWELTKNKKGTLGGWHVRWDAKTHRLDVVSSSGGRAGAAAAGS